MNQQLLQQLALQGQLSEKGRATDPQSVVTIGEFVDYVQGMQRFLNMEIEEILQLVPIDARKPWKGTHESTRQMRVDQLVDMEHLREEAIDALCFLMNIMLVCGVTPTNFAGVFNKVIYKNQHRCENEY